ncbi:hypothetical protein IY145_22560 [Methylosinus sp. H3A]|nr:DUF5989 family protein [Methylosinus sp. H3A]MBG0812129.1 hypothetical protein [Methylosinus sp. H3A]
MDMVLELWDFVTSRKKYWMAPVLAVMLLLGGLLLLQGTAVAPFIYTLF